MSRGCWLAGPAAPLACDRNTSCEGLTNYAVLNEVAGIVWRSGMTVWRTGVEVTGNVCSSPRRLSWNATGAIGAGFKAFEPEGLGFA